MKEPIRGLVPLSASYTRLPSKKEKAAPNDRPRMRKKVMRDPADSQSFPCTILMGGVKVRTLKAPLIYWCSPLLLTVDRTPCRGSLGNRWRRQTAP